MDMMLSQSLLIKSLHKKPLERTPVWIMRQAGRYLPEYRKLREKAGDFLSLCKTPELACEITLQPLRRYHLDAAILFSDILTIPDAMGLGLHFIEGEGPQFLYPLRTLSDIVKLPVPVIEDELDYVLNAVKMIRHTMPNDLPLIGFSGSPWTLACYMVEGGSSKDYKRVLRLMYESPESMHLLLTKLSNAVIDYLSLQVSSGVNVIMLFDTWGGILSTPQFQTFSLNYMQQIVSHLKMKHPNVPIIVFTKGGGLWLKDLASIGCDALGLDWTCSLTYAREVVGEKVALQGNLDPTILLTNPQCIKSHVEKILDSYGFGSGHIFNLGHGITPDVPPEHVQVMIEAIHKLSPKYHSRSNSVLA